MNGTKNGECRFGSRTIAIRGDIAPAQMVKTLAHELGHVILHNPEDQTKRQIERPIAELEAESVAYVLCRELGIDSGSYIFGYIAAWAGGGEEATKALGGSASAIHRASHVVLDLLQNDLSRGVDQQVAESPARFPHAWEQELADSL